MTATATKPTDQSSLVYVEVAKLRAHPDNPRADLGDLTDLTASVKASGILEPLIVAPPHEGVTDKLMGKATRLVLVGHRRLAAAKKARLKLVPAIIRDDITSRAAQLETMLTEQLQRVEFTPVEEADAYQLALKLEGCTQKELAARLGQSPTRIKERLKLTRISEPIRAKLQAHQCTIADALAVAEFDDDPDAQKPILRAVGSDDFAFQLRSARATRERRKERAALEARVEAMGVEIQDTKPKMAGALVSLGMDAPPVYSDLEVQLAWAEEHHADCPGRTAWRTGYHPAIVLGCLDPSLHTAAPEVSSPSTRERDEEAEKTAAAERAEREQEAADLAAATAVRREFLAATLRERTAADTGTRLRALILERLSPPKEEWWVDVDGANLLLQVLGTDSVDVTNIEEADQGVYVRAIVDAALERLTVDQLVFVLDVASHLDAESMLASRQGWYDGAAPWLRALNAHGYGWSDFERGRFRWVDGSETPQTVDGPVEEPDADEPEQAAS